MTSPAREPYTELIPRPDPTKLTTEAVARTTEEFRRELGNLREIITARLDGMDKAIELSSAERERLLYEGSRRLAHEREFIMAQIESVRSVMLEKFAAVDSTFAASKVAVDAAFAASEEAGDKQNTSSTLAIDKSDAATKEQIGALSRVTDAGIKGLSDKIDDARTRLTTLESRTAGIRENEGSQRSERAETREEANRRTLVLGAALAVVTIIVNVLIALSLHGGKL